MVACVVAMQGAAGLRLQAQTGEPSRLVIRQLSFEGNRALDDYTLGISIATTPSSFLARQWWIRWLGAGDKRYLDETELRRDVARLVLLYRVSGFLHARVDTIVRRSKDAVSIKFVIVEGQPVRVRAIEIHGGEGIVSERSLLHDLPLGVGEPFNRIRFEWAADTIRTAVRDRGYPFAEVFRSYEVDEASLSARLRFDIVPGPKARVDTVLVEGVREIEPGVVRRMIALRPGTWFSQSALYQAQRDLYRLGVFSYVDVRLADSLPRPGDSTVSVRVQVAEGRLRRVRFGVGYGTVDCFRALAGWTGSNVFGGGQSLELSARVSKVGAGAPLEAGLERFPCTALRPDTATERFRLNYNLTARFDAPFVFSRVNRGSLALSADQHSEIQAYLRRALGGSVTLIHASRWGVPVTLGYALSLTQTFAEPAVFCAFLNVCRLEDAQEFTRRRVQSMLSLGWIRERANSVLDPTRGSTLSAEVRYASRLLGSDSLIQFAKGVADAAWYLPLGRRTTLAWRLRAGGIVSPRLGFTGQSVRFIPPSERFYAGGPNTVRGYGQNQLGPVVRVVSPDRPDTLTAATGGNALLLANAELRFPLPGFWGRLSGAAFVDAGQLLERETALWTLREAKITPGVGLRLATLLGPMRVDAAYNGYPPQEGPLYRREGQALVLVDPAFRPQRGGSWLRQHITFHFSVGQAF
jgi:outer membrane protein assembly complex protein YaeT